METKIPERYQGRLTSDNAAVLLVDHQVGLFTGVRDIPVAELKHNLVAPSLRNVLVTAPYFHDGPLWQVAPGQPVRTGLSG